jgi:hypothetical protein
MRCAALLLVALTSAVVGCADASLFAFGPGAPADGAAAGEATLATPGCDAGTIVDDGAVVCAACTFDDGAGGETGAAICGAPVEAPCEVRQNNVGEACQLCVTAAGEILYDDCFAAAEDAREAAASCEVVAGLDDGQTCTNCFDDVGNLLSTTCAPASDRCASVVIDGRDCERCFAGDVVVSTTCPAVDLDPRQCRAYGNDQGRCVDCFDDAGALVSHACTPAGGPQTIACRETVQPEGLVCTVCVDENGTPVDESCADAVPQPERCTQLAYSEQTCQVCVDDTNAVVFVDCVRNDCAVPDVVCRVDADCAVGEVCFDGSCVAAQDNGAGAAPVDCPPPPACAMEVIDGDVCRKCPRDDGVVETLCVTPSVLSCEVIPEGNLPPDAGTDTPPVDAGRSCVLCRDTQSGLEVYRDCAGNGVVPPPYCIDETDDAGATCSVCYDAVTDAPVYTSCAGETCFAQQSLPLEDADGQAFVINGAPAVVSCKQCGDAGAIDAAVDAATALSAVCTVDNVCTLTDEGTQCLATTTLVLAPRQCSNAWDGVVQGSTSVDELRGLVRYALETHQIVLASVTRTPPDPDSTACGSCACERGDRIVVEVPEAAAASARTAFADVLVP